MTALTVSVVLAAVLFLFDFQNLLARWKGMTLQLDTASSEDVTIILPVYGAPHYFSVEQRARLRPIRHLCLVAVDVGGDGMDIFAEELEAEGWRIARTCLPDPAAPILMANALSVVETNFVMRLDADTQVSPDVLRAVAAIAEDGAEIASIKCHVANEHESWATRFQALEYRMAMLSRHFRPWLTSGACHIGRTEAMREIFRRHSLWMPGEDVEMGRVATALRMRVRHIEGVEVLTDAPANWRALYRQRRLWWAGNFRHVVVNFDKNALQMPVWTFYYIALVWVGVYFKWWTIGAIFLSPSEGVRTLFLLIGIYAVVTLIGNWQVKQPLMALFPIYALIQAVLMPLIGTIYYVALARQKRKMGRYGFGMRRRRAPIASAAQ